MLVSFAPLFPQFVIRYRGCKCAKCEHQLRYPDISVGTSLFNRPLGRYIEYDRAVRRANLRSQKTFLLDKINEITQFYSRLYESEVEEKILMAISCESNYSVRNRLGEMFF